MYLAILAILAASIPAQTTIAPSERFWYSASVSFFENRCRFWTGDAMLDAGQFHADLRTGFDPARGLTIYYSAEVPAKCVAKAQRVARQAHFRAVRAMIGAVDLSLP